MKYVAFLLGVVLAIAAHQGANAASAEFGCGARAPQICYFHIFYERGGRDVVLPAGTKQAIPDLRIGKDSYCVAVDQKPRRAKCNRKVIGPAYNS
jgi:hypothetical protein